jgi:tyrosyl-tRNA synthetase
MEAKKKLAGLIVTEYHDADAAEGARRHFEARFQRHQIPDNVPVFKLAQELWVCELMKQLRFAASTSEARRLLSQGAVRVDGQTVTDGNFRFVPGELGPILHDHNAAGGRALNLSARESRRGNRA